MAEFSPTPEQIAALAAKTPLLILAGAGTGKTTVLTHRIANLVAEGRARPEEILALTFADKAAAEMGQRLASLLEERGMGDAGREIHCSTFHSFGAEVIREHAALLGMESDCRVLSTPESWQLLSRVLDGLDFEAIDLSGNLGRVLAGLLALFSRAKDRLVGPERLISFLKAQDVQGLPEVAAAYWRERLAARRDAAVAYREYEAAKRQRSYLDYGDLLALPVQLFAEHPEVRDLYRVRYRHLFVDEYQDTNYAQKVLLFELLAEDAGIVVIGDDDQSIYGWRGAEIRNILDFLKEPALKDRPACRVELAINRRSGERILGLANHIVAGLQERSKGNGRLLPMAGAPPSRVGHFVAGSADSEARWIARTIRQHHDAQDVEDPTGKKRGYGLFAVLCRKRSLFEPIARALEAEGVPYELIGGTGFFGRREVRDVLSYLRVLADPADNIALARILQSPPWRLSDRDLFHLSRWARGDGEGRERREGREGRENIPSLPSLPSTDHPEEDLSFRLVDAIAHHQEIPGLCAEARGRLDRFDRLLDSLALEGSRIPLAELADRVIEGTGYRRELSARGDLDSRLALLNLGKLVELARKFEGEEGGIDAFVEYLQYALESGDEEEVLPVDEESDAAKVMTIHQAKGLEFPAVFVPGLASRIFPDLRVDDPDRWDQLPGEFLRPEAPPALELNSITTARALDAARKQRNELLSQRELEGERRLFYVALTRAQTRLYLSRAHWYFSNVKPREPSLFWEEVVDSGLSEPLGEEQVPGSNPRLQPGGPQGASRTEVRSENPARLLLQPEALAARVEQVASLCPEAWAQRRKEVDRRIASVASCRPARTSGRRMEVSCTGLIRYDRCPRLFRFLYVDRVPERPSPWAALGTEVHRRIEEMAGKTEPLAAEVEGPGSDRELLEETAGGDHGLGLEELLAAYRESPYARRRPARLEEPFALPMGGHLLRGRIDRLDRLADGSWELVDFKSGRFSGRIGRQQQLQLQLYSLAAWRLWGVDPRELSCHLFFLASRHDEVLRFPAEELQGIEAWAVHKLEEMQRGVFPVTADRDNCIGCDYSFLCAADGEGG